MAYEITLPRLGWDMAEGVLDSWLRKDGEFVQAGEMLFSVEGDKAVQEIEALDSGYLRLLTNGPQVGDKVPVGTLLGYLVPEEELATFHPEEGPTAPMASPSTLGMKTVEPASVTTPPAVQTSQQAGARRRIYISPYARRLAEGLGVEWQTINGSGRAGRIMARDIQATLAQRKAAGPSTPPAPIPRPAALPPSVAQASSGRSPLRQPMTKVRRNTAEHMSQSAHTTAPVTLFCEVDATELVALRQQLKNDLAVEDSVVPSYNDILARIAAQALLEHPELNATLEGEEIVQFATVNVAIAVESERGLLTPVLRDVQTKSLRQIARESAALIEKTRQGTIGYQDLQDGTFTITNLGMFEIEAFTPIINLPQCAILGVGQIVAKQVVLDAKQEQLAIRKRMVLSLTFDHRLVDGAQAGRFLQRIKRLIEKPYLWLAGS
jgi:pyruvate dehydrogenase E2 component (dihydrolipoamide acetyltransferase)